MQLTTDGERYYGFAARSRAARTTTISNRVATPTSAGRRQGARRGRPRERQEVRPARAGLWVSSWSQDNKKFSLQRSDTRKVGELWVINSLANPRPRLETYKYGMPGEENQPQAELQVFDIAAEEG